MRWEHHPKHMKRYVLNTICLTVCDWMDVGTRLIRHSSNACVCKSVIS
jgi:hypothetical protein